MDNEKLNELAKELGSEKEIHPESITQIAADEALSKGDADQAASILANGIWGRIENKGDEEESLKLQEEVEAKVRENL